MSIKVFQKLTGRTNAALEGISQVSQLFSVSGEYDLIAIVQAQSLEELSAVLTTSATWRGWRGPTLPWSLKPGSGARQSRSDQEPSMPA